MAPQQPTPRQTRNSRILRPLSPGLNIFSASAFFDQNNRQSSSQESATGATAQVHEAPDNQASPSPPTPQAPTTPLQGTAAFVLEPIAEGHSDSESQTDAEPNEGQISRSFFEIDERSVISNESYSPRNSTFQGDHAAAHIPSSPSDHGVSISPSHSDGATNFASASESYRPGGDKIIESQVSQSNRGDPTLPHGESALLSIAHDDDQGHTTSDDPAQRPDSSETTCGVQGCQAHLDEARQANDLAHAQVTAATEEYKYQARRARVLPLDLNKVNAPHPRFQRGEDRRFVRRAQKEGPLFAAKLYQSILEDHRVRGCICGAPTIYSSGAEAEVGKGHLRFYLNSTNQPDHLQVLQVRDDTVWHCICSHTSLYETYPRKRKADDDELDLVRQDGLADPAAGPEAEGRQAVEPEEAALAAAPVHVPVPVPAATTPPRQLLRRILESGQDFAVRSRRLWAHMSGAMAVWHGKARALPGSIVEACGRMRRDLPELIRAQGDLVEVRRRSPETQQIVVKRLRRQNCLPVDEEERKAAEAEIARIKNGLLFFSWAQEPQRHIGADLIAIIYRDLKTQAEAIDGQRVWPALSVERQVATIPEGHDLPLSIAIHHFMTEKLGLVLGGLHPEHGDGPWEQAVNTYRKSLGIAMEFMAAMYSPDSPAFVQAKVASAEPTTIPTFASYDARTHVRTMAEFLQWFITLKDRRIFEMPRHVEEAFFKILVDAKAVHKKEAPPSWVVTPGLGQNQMPGTFPNDGSMDDMYEEVPVDELTFDPVYDVRFPNSESPSANMGGHKPGKHRAIRPRRGVLRAPTEAFPVNGWVPADCSGTFAVPPGTPERLEPGKTFAVPDTPVSPDTPERAEPGRTFAVPDTPVSPDTPQQSDAVASPTMSRASPGYVPTYNARRLEKKPRKRLAFKKEISLFAPPNRLPVRVTKTKISRPRRRRIVKPKFGDDADIHFMKEPVDGESEDEEDQFPLPGSVRVQDLDEEAETTSPRGSEEARSAAEASCATHNNEAAAGTDNDHHRAALPEQGAEPGDQDEAAPEDQEEAAPEDHIAEAANHVPGRPSSLDGADASQSTTHERTEPYHEDEFTDLLVEMHSMIRVNRNYWKWERPFEREQREMRKRMAPAKTAEERRQQIALFFEDREMKDSGVVGPRGTLGPKESLEIATAILDEKEIEAQLCQETVTGLERKLREALKIQEEEEARRIAEEEERRRLQEQQRKKAEQQRAKDLAAKRRRLAAAELGLRLPKKPLVTPLSQEWENRVNAAAAQPWNTKLGVTPEPADFQARDLVERLLPPTAWLNDTVVIGSVLGAAAAINKAAGATAANPKCAALTSFFWPRLTSNGPTSCARLMKRANIRADNFLDLDSILVPICEGPHWTLAVVRPRLRQVAHMDSLLGGRGNPATRARLMGWVRATLGQQFVEAEWREVDLPSPRQTNGYDCGVFTIANAICIGLGVEPTATYAPADLTAMRRRLAAVLLNGGFEGELGLAGL